MALLRKRFASHLSEAAQQALSACKPYPPPQILRNPLMRSLVRKYAEAEWASTLKQIDFPHAMDDEVIAGVNCVRYRTDQTDPAAPVILYLHAGAFIFGSARVNAAAALPVCHLTGSEAIAVDYTVAPDAVYPTQIEQIERVYLSLLKNGRRSDEIILLGDSAGGAMALSSCLRWRRKGIPLPSSVILLSPVADAQGRSDTFTTMRGHDPLFGVHGVDGIATVYALYAPGEDLTDPEVSPIEGDYSDLPPMLVHSGSREIFLGDAVRVAENARRAGLDVSLRVFDGMFHLFHQHWSLKEAKEAHEDIAAFVRRIAPAKPKLSSIAS